MKKEIISAVISDVHGNIWALKAVLNDIRDKDIAIWNIFYSMWRKIGCH